MKKFLLTGVFLAFGFVAYAQVDVVATGGTASATYTTLKGAFDKINDGTHQGAINITITASTTETASAALNASGSGSASYTSVFIKPNTTATISGTNGDGIINLNGADNVTIDGSATVGGTTKDLIIYSDNTGNTGCAIKFVNGASNNTVKNCIIKGNGQGANNTGVIWFSNGGGNNENLITNNDITNSTASRPSNAIFSAGASNKLNTDNIISYNNIFDFDTTGIREYSYTKGTRAEYNNIYMTATINNDTELTGIRPSGVALQVQLPSYIGNKIYNLKNTSTHVLAQVTGIRIVGIQNVSGNTAVIANNMIWGLEGGSSSNISIAGIRDETAATPLVNILIYNNTIVLSGTGGEDSSYCYNGETETSTSLVTLKNNIFVNTRTGTGSSINATIRNRKTYATTVVSDYNLLYNSGGTRNYLAYDRSSASEYTTYSDFATYQNAAVRNAGVHSINVNPSFVSTSDLHISPCSTDLDGKGTYISDVATDIDGDTRNTSTPDIGADEYTPTAVISSGTALSSPADDATGVSTSPTFTWTAVSGATGYKLYLGTTSGGTDVLNGTDVGNVTSYDVSGLAEGTTYYAKVEAYNVCYNIAGSETTFTTESTLAVSNIKKADISVYPNPFTDILKISDVKDVKSVSINDMSGRQVKILTPATELNLSDLKSGLYIINLAMEDGSVKSVKAIKK
ncbi:MAG: T9SS type A sorting domain-containing protein [Bergeyella sp.]